MAYMQLKQAALEHTFAYSQSMHCTLQPLQRQLHHRQLLCAEAVSVLAAFIVIIVQKVIQGAKGLSDRAFSIGVAVQA